MILTDIQQEISELIEEELARLTFPDEPESLYDPVRYTLAMGGKRIRPYFTLTSCGLCDGDIEEAAPAAMAIELLHNFTLLHDDIMDSAPSRRGLESVHKKWNNSIAILSGDAMYARAFDLLQYYGQNKRFSKEQYFSILDMFLNSAIKVCEGQAYDLDFEDNTQPDLNSYLKMIRGKTAALLSAAFKIGAKVADAGDEELQLLAKTGEEAGIAFQIQDDLLDVAADPEQFGKKAAGDILEGKKTYLFILALQKSNEEQKKTLLQIYDQKKITNEDVENVIAIYSNLSIFDTARQTVNDYYDQSIQRIKLFDNSEYKTSLIEFLTNLKNREY